MTIRERVNERPGLTGVAVALVTVAVVTVAVRMNGSSPPSAGSGEVAKHFFSVDDGTTWFAADASNVPPFQRDGKTAYRARVFKCGHGDEFVSHLERYGEDARKRLSDIMARGAAGGGGAAAVEQFGFAHELEVKKPGERRWVRMTPETAADYQRITQPKCPHGSTAGVQPVLAK